MWLNWLLLGLVLWQNPPNVRRFCKKNPPNVRRFYKEALHMHESPCTNLTGRWRPWVPKGDMLATQSFKHFKCPDCEMIWTVSPWALCIGKCRDWDSDPCP